MTSPYATLSPNLLSIANMTRYSNLKKLTTKFISTFLSLLSIFESSSKLSNLVYQIKQILWMRISFLRIICRRLLIITTSLNRFSATNKSSNSSLINRKSKEFCWVSHKNWLKYFQKIFPFPLILDSWCTSSGKNWRELNLREVTRKLKVIKTFGRN